MVDITTLFSDKEIRAWITYITYSKRQSLEVAQLRTEARNV